MKLFGSWIRKALAIDPDRPLYIHGPVTRITLAVISLSSLIAAAGFVISLVTYSHELGAIQASRIQVGIDTCQTLRKVISHPPMSRPFPAIINGKHATVTFILPSKVRKAFVASQIKADGLEHCKNRAHNQAALAK